MCIKKQNLKLRYLNVKPNNEVICEIVYPTPLIPRLLVIAVRKGSDLTIHYIT